jgi:hypothetical protein
VTGVLGAVILIVMMVLVGPLALFVGGALWSALIGNTLSPPLRSGQEPTRG